MQSILKIPRTGYKRLRSLRRKLVKRSRQAAGYFSAPAPLPAPDSTPYIVRRLVDEPIVSVDTHPFLEGNVNGPSLIHVPEWLPDPLGRYYLYFANHRGRFIRLAYADELTGPWRIHEPGTLHLDATTCHGHIASPDVHVDDQGREIRMYFHGPSLSKKAVAAERTDRNVTWPDKQRTKVALSQDGLSFEALPENLGPAYFRVFRRGDWWYALAMPGLFLRSPDGLADWEEGPVLFDLRMRHSAVRVVDGWLEVFYTRAGDCPERVLRTMIDLRADWRSWREHGLAEVMRPERPWEGGDLRPRPSQRGAVDGRVCQLRDPGVYEEGGRLYLLYSVAGEQGLGIAELQERDPGPARPGAVEMAGSRRETNGQNV